MKPNQKVIIYRNGVRGKTMAQYHNEYRLAMPEYFECPKCGRAVKKGATGNLKKHYSDFPNRLKCPAGIDKQGPGGQAGIKRGPYKKRTQKRVYDKPRRSVDSLRQPVVE